MIKSPMSPRVHQQVTQVLVRHFSCSPTQAAELTTRLIKVLRSYDLDIVPGDWMAAPHQEAIREDRWTSLAKVAEELVTERNGIKPWMPPELL